MATIGKRPQDVHGQEQRAKVVQLRIDGLSYSEIAAECGISQPRAYQLLSDELRRRKAETGELVQELVQVELARLDKMLKKVLQQAEAGDVKSVAAVLAIMDRKSRFLGMDAPAKSQVEVLSNMTDDEMQEEARRLGISVAVSPLLQLTNKPAVEAEYEAKSEPGRVGTDEHDKL